MYDTNVGDISPLSSYFNPQRWTVRDLNEKFGIQTQTPELSVGVDAASPVPEGDEDISEADIDLIAKEESLIDDKTGLPIRYSSATATGIAYANLMGQCRQSQPDFRAAIIPLNLGSVV